MKGDEIQKAKLAKPQTCVHASPFTEGRNQKEERMSFEGTREKKLINIVRAKTMNQFTGFYETQGFILQIYGESLDKYRDDMILRNQEFLAQQGKRRRTRNVYKLTVSEGKLTGEVRFDHTSTKVYWDSMDGVWKPIQ